MMNDDNIDQELVMFCYRSILSQGLSNIATDWFEDYGGMLSAVLSEDELDLLDEMIATKVNMLRIEEGFPITVLATIGNEDEEE